MHNNSDIESKGNRMLCGAVVIVILSAVSIFVNRGRVGWAAYAGPSICILVGVLGIVAACRKDFSLAKAYVIGLIAVLVMDLVIYGISLIVSLGNIESIRDEYCRQYSPCPSLQEFRASLMLAFGLMLSTTVCSCGICIYLGKSYRDAFEYQAMPVLPVYNPGGGIPAQPVYGQPVASAPGYHQAAPGNYQQQAYRQPMGGFADPNKAPM